MRTLITLIIGIIIGAVGLFYGIKNGMIKLNMTTTEETAEHKPHAEAEAAAPKAAAPAHRTPVASPAPRVSAESEVEDDDFDD